MRMKGRLTGFTLIELMVTLAVAIILLAVGIPLYDSIVNSNKAVTGVNDMITALQLARSEATARSVPVGVCARTANAQTCGNSWNNGWLLYADNNRNGVLDTAESVVRVWDAGVGTSYSVKSNGAAIGNILFSPVGELKGTNPVSVQMVSSSQTRCVLISVSGQVRQQKGACP